MILKFSFKPSYYLLGILSFASLSSLFIIVCMPMTAWLKTLLATFVLSSTAFYLAKDALMLLPASWVALEINSENQCILSARNGVRQPITVLAESLVISHIIVLQLKTNKRFLRKNLILLPDSANPDDLRRLRVWLKWASLNNEVMIEEAKEEESGGLA